MSNRHGLIAGATGTGKTVTLQLLAEGFSAQGVPVLITDVKGDLSGISQPAVPSPKVDERRRRLGVADLPLTGCPATFWDVFGEQGHPVRTTVSEMGPLLLGRMLQLNETQSGVLHIVFRVADDEGLLLLDLKDLRAMLTYVAENAAGIIPRYGNVSVASVGAIQRALLLLEQQGGEVFFGEPALNLDDLIQTDPSGRGIVNVLSADRLMLSPRLYGSVLLWILSELFENSPEIGDQPRPKLVLFFDEAHLLFQDVPAALREKIELVVRLIRSKGIGIFFVTQNPRDIPDTILGQLGNRIQHALRAFTPNDQIVVRAAARTFRANPALDTESVLTQLGVGEALVSLLDESGQPSVVQRALIYPPQSQIGPISSAQRQQLMASSLVRGIYDQVLDRESAYERLARVTRSSLTEAARAEPDRMDTAAPTPVPPRATRAQGRPPDTYVQTMAKSALRTVGSTLGRELVRGLLGSILGRRR